MCFHECFLDSKWGITWDLRECLATACDQASEKPLSQRKQPVFSHSHRAVVLIGKSLEWQVLVLGDNRCTSLNVGGAFPEVEKHISVHKGLVGQKAQEGPCST